MPGHDRVAPGRAILVVNARSGPDEEPFERAQAGLARAGLPLAAAHHVHEPGALPGLVRDELARGATQVIVGGGDGTLSAVAGVVAGSPAVMSVLPLGTANDFARSIRVPFDLEAACRVAAAGRVRAVDLARAGPRPFLNAASFGISSGLMRRLADGELKKRAGPLAYPAAAAAEVAAHQPFRARLETAEGVRELDALQVVIGNGRFHGGGRLVTPEARVDDRRLELYAVLAEAGPEESGSADRLRDVLTLARYAFLLARGRHLEHPRIVHERTARVTISTEPPMEINADGERAGTTPATFELFPERLRVTVPA